MQITESLLDIENIKKSKKPLLDLLIRRTAVVTSTQESLTEKIIKDQWHNASKVSQAGSPISEIEFPNIGTFFISKSKASKRIIKIEEQISKLDPLTNQEQIDKHLNHIRLIRIKTKTL